MSSPAFPVHWDTYEQSPERQLIAIALTVSKDATTRTGLNVSSKDIVRELVSVNTSRNTVNTYFSDKFGLQLLLDQNHVFETRQRFCKGNRKKFQF